MTDDLCEIALFALKKHSDYYDPYVDDYPSARHAAAEHRKDCPYCEAYERLNAWNQKKKAKTR